MKTYVIGRKDGFFKMDYNPFLKVKDTIFGAKDNFMILDEDD